AALAAVRKNEVNRAYADLAVGVVTGFYVATGVVVIVCYEAIKQRAAQQGIVVQSWWVNPALLRPLGFAIGTGIWLLITAGRQPRAAAIGVALIVAADLVSFGQRFEWRFASVMLPRPTPETTLIEEEIHAAQGRFLPADGYYEPLAPWTPNLNELYGITSASGFTPLLPQRYQEA